MAGLVILSLVPLLTRLEMPEPDWRAPTRGKNIAGRILPLSRLSDRRFGYGER
jgi:hypothetical protein